MCKQSTSLDRSSEPVRGQESRPTPHESTSPPAPDKDSSPSTQDQESQESSPSKMKELQEKLAKLNSRYVVGSGCSGEKSEVGKVGLAALQDIAARQEATLEDKTPTNDQSLLRYDPISNKMSLGSLPSSPARSAQSRSPLEQKFFLLLQFPPSPSPQKNNKTYFQVYGFRQQLILDPELTHMMFR